MRLPRRLSCLWVCALLLSSACPVERPSASSPLPLSSSWYGPQAQNGGERTQNAADASWDKVLSAHAAGDWKQVLSLLDVLARDYPASFKLRHGDFLKAAALRQLGRHQEAEPILESLQSANSPLQPLVLFALFEISRDAKRADAAEQWLERYRAEASPLVDLDRAAWEQARLVHVSDPPRGRVLLRTLARGRGRYRRQAQLLWSDVEPDKGLQRTLRLQLIASRQNDDIAYEAGRKLLPATVALEASALEDLLDVLLANRDLDGAIEVGKHSADRFAQSAEAPFFGWALGRAWMLRSEWNQSLAQFQQTYDRFPASRWGLQSAYFKGHVYLRMEKYAEAVSAYQRIIDEHPGSEFEGGAYVNQVDALRRLGRREEALQAARNGGARLKGADSALLHYSAAKILMASSPADALSEFQAALLAGERAKFPPSLGMAELHYWIGFCRERLQLWIEAAGAYLESARQDTNYFGFLARGALQRLYAERSDVQGWSDHFLGEAETARETGRSGEYRQALRSRYLSAPPPDSDDARRRLMSELGSQPEWMRIANTPLWPADRIDDLVLASDLGSRHTQAAALLGGLGFYQKAGELVRSAPNMDNKTQQALTAASFFGKANRWGEAIAAARKLSASLPFDSPDLMPKRLAVFFLPLPFSGSGRNASEEAEPELIASIILRESLFQPDAKSPAGARGLMQLMPSTARDTARDLGLAPPALEELYDPAVSIRLGTAHVNKLLRQLRHAEMAVAAYNGGSENVLRWASGNEPFDRARFVADIGFAETKSYVMRVLGNYRLYKILYAD